MIKGMHHNAYRCRDSEETRRFYEDFLEMPLAGAIEITETMTGRATHVLHTFYALGDGSYLAFFEAPDRPFEFKSQHDFDLHIALEVDPELLDAMLAKGRAAGIESRGIADHGFIRSIYLRDPNGYVIELTGRMPGHDQAMDPATNAARDALDRWQAMKAPLASALASAAM
ncbi:MAG TPA: VOC family protein [Arenibaculum sp.]|nr:VOC family protein [Arenibaculum sp.]